MNKLNFLKNYLVDFPIKDRSETKLFRLKLQTDLIMSLIKDEIIPSLIMFGKSEPSMFLFHLHHSFQRNPKTPHISLPLLCCHCLASFSLRRFFFLSLHFIFCSNINPLPQHKFKVLSWRWVIYCSEYENSSLRMVRLVR